MAENNNNSTLPEYSSKSTDISEEKAAEMQAENSKEAEQKRKGREEDEKIEDGLKHLIDNATLQCTLCTNPKGILKVNYDTPTTQDRKTGTVKEKDETSIVFMGTCKKSPQSSSPCASVMQLGDWKDTGSSKSQDEFVLLQKSTIKCNYGGVDITVTDCGQIDEPGNLNTESAPLPDEKQDDTEYIYYTKDGFYLGGLESSSKVFISTQSDYDSAKASKKWSSVNVDGNLLKENSKNISNNEFANNSYLVFHEAALTGNKNTALWIAHTVNNALHSKYKRTKKTFNELFKTGYSSVGSTDKKTIINADNKSQNKIYARFAVIDVLIGGKDPTGTAYFWDGLDLFTRKGELDQPKFKQYTSVMIYTSHLESAVAFWSIDDNKRKVNPKATINSIFTTKYALTKVTDGAIEYNQTIFVGVRTDSQNNSDVTEDLVSTGFQSGTLFWTTHKPKTKHTLKPKKK